MSTAIGIDLGTTACCVAVYKDGQVNIIPNEQNETTTPSYYTFYDNLDKVGTPAMTLALSLPENVIYDAKRLIGRSFNDIDRTMLKSWKFEVENKDRKPKFRMIGKNSCYDYLTPEEVSGKILQKLKKDAEDYLKAPIKDAVITVPAYFGDSQREATKLAAEKAGINILRLVNEPTAALLSYSHNKMYRIEKETVLVFDMGGGTLDITIAEIDGVLLEILSTSGDTKLGGRDIDINLADFLMPQIDEQCGEGIQNSAQDFMRLLKACNEAKHALSAQDSTSFKVSKLFRRKNFSASVTREQFCGVNKTLFDRSMACVDKAVSDSKLSNKDIEVVLLVGGSSRIPRINELLREKCPQAEFMFIGNPEETVARGAAIRAAMMSGNEPTLSGVVVVDVCPLSIGIDLKHGCYKKYVARNTIIPFQKIITVQNHTGDQRFLSCGIYEGESDLASENNKLGELQLGVTEAAQKREITYDVTFFMDADGILHVKAGEGNTGVVTYVTENKRFLEANNRESKLEGAKRFAEADRLEEERIEVLQDFKKYLKKLKNDKATTKSPMLLSNIKIAETWLAKNPKASRENLQMNFEEFKRCCQTVLAIQKPHSSRQTGGNYW